LTEDGSTVQWFIDGQSAFDAIASSIEQAKSEVSFSSISLWFLQQIVLLACHVK
jgi:PIN domain nuclease of toxin-antitoxin system